MCLQIPGNIYHGQLHFVKCSCIEEEIKAIKDNEYIYHKILHFKQLG